VFGKSLVPADCTEQGEVHDGFFDLRLFLAGVMKLPINLSETDVPFIPLFQKKNGKESETLKLDFMFVLIIEDDQDAQNLKTKN